MCLKAYEKTKQPVCENNCEKYHLQLLPCLIFFFLKLPKQKSLRVSHISGVFCLFSGYKCLDVVYSISFFFSILVVHIKTEF